MKINYERVRELNAEAVKRNTDKVEFYQLALKYAKRTTRIHVLKAKIAYYQDMVRYVSDDYAD